jgi:DNA-directed RNA polymerase subunit M/transcription elongation factor TFIIS
MDLDSVLLNGIDKYIPAHINRKKVYDKFYNFLSDNNQVKEFGYIQDDIKKMSINLERGIFNYALKLYSLKSNAETWNDVFKNTYISRAVTIYNNLSGPSINSSILLHRYLSKEFDEFGLCLMTPEQINPEKWKELKESIAEKKVFQVLERPDGLFKCGKCKSYKTEYNERQTRSADEPTTKFCYCYNCGHRWRFC